MQRKVKFFDKLYDTDTLDEEINAWIENYDKELIDVKLTVDREEESDYVLFNNKNDAINELHRLRGVKYRNSRMYTVEMLEVEG